MEKAIGKVESERKQGYCLSREGGGGGCSSVFTEVKLDAASVYPQACDQEVKCSVQLCEYVFPLS